MDEDSSRTNKYRFRRLSLTHCIAVVLWVALPLLLWGTITEAGNAQDTASIGTSSPKAWQDVISSGAIIATVVLLTLSAFFSASEVAFFSLHKIQLLAMADSRHLLDRMAAGLMEKPSDLLTTILMSNSIVNVLLSVVLATRVEQVFSDVLLLSPVLAYFLAVLIGTGALIFFGEITPKVLVVRMSERFARFAALPLVATSTLLKPLRHAMMGLIHFLFRVTRFSEVRPAPFMTDEEFMSLISEGEASGAIEADEREMIESILEFTDSTVKEILIPRPDMIALSRQATVGEALELFRQHGFSRMPVYRDDIDHITGVLIAKDLLPVIETGELNVSIKSYLRDPSFVPETMTVANFVKSAQKTRTHLAIVVDEFGGTEGLVTLQDAIREVVGDIAEEGHKEREEVPVTELSEGVYHVEGNLPLDELEELTGVSIDDESHTTVAGFLMEQNEKILEEGDEIAHAGIVYTVEAVEGKRASRLKIEIPVAGKEGEGNHD